MMKKFLGVLVTILMAAPAMARVSNQEFLDKLVKSVNEQLVVINKERAADGKKLYCQQLSEQGVQSLAKYALKYDLRSYDVLSFVSSAADQLFCYPLACPSQGRASLGGAICNAKSYNMDLSLLRAALSSMNGAEVENYDTLQSIAERAR
ncbi:hypothetical protein [Bdellovibrio svalbardensis]|uniref:Uncharacterized protein n=1 Tax=Bdellovibrio svalbardensis TaxID=2972972 RepID=A0ABT6DGW9_9BACT|nr:hypothetical protein [Bdellovibrio svalbardensis]MDG0815510.1 hypothetical protein [Bdellovibrio svalbardensis]